MSKSKRTTKMKTTTKTTTPKVLDEQTSAIVIAEYLAIEKVTAAETTAVTEEPGRSLTYREIAIAFRISEVLDVPDPFKIAPRYQLAFDRAREYHVIRQVVAERQTVTAQTETRS